MTAIAIRSWAAWSPGIETEADWRKWAADPCRLASEGAPEARFIPAMLRRRCDQLSRMMLHVAERSTENLNLSGVRSVFASRYGSLSTMLSMLERLAMDAPLSPSHFSHSVHNTQAGLFSICSKNFHASTSIAARRQTFAHAFLEAVSVLHTRPEGLGTQANAVDPVLLVIGDQAIPDFVASRSDSGEGAYALALLLGPADGDGGLELSIEAGTSTRQTDDAGPDALRFLRWLLSNAPTLRLVHPQRTWVWKRRSATANGGKREKY